MNKDSNVSNPIFRVYLSHPIMGINGSSATQEEINKNIEIAKEVGRELQAYAIDWEKMDGFPPIYIYVPADHDEFIQIAYQKGYITITEILDCDCEIINKCQLVIMYGTYYSSGMQIEFNYAKEHGIPTLNIPQICNETVSALQMLIHIILLGDH